jgi:hypothetical protein
LKKGGIVYAKLCTVQYVFCVQEAKHKKIKYENFLLEEARSWMLEVQNPTELSFDELQLPENNFKGT